MFAILPDNRVIIGVNGPFWKGLKCLFSDHDIKPTLVEKFRKEYTCTKCELKIVVITPYPVQL